MTRRWMARAACAGMDTAVFFPARGDAAGHVAAKAICARCPVIGECAAYAIARPGLDGVWGGLSERGRQRARRRRTAA